MYNRPRKEKLTWSLPPHPPAGTFAHKAFAFPLLALSARKLAGLTSRSHHAHRRFHRLTWVVSPATGLDFQPQTLSSATIASIPDLNINCKGRTAQELRVLNGYFVGICGDGGALPRTPPEGLSPSGHSAPCARGCARCSARLQARSSLALARPPNSPLRSRGLLSVIKQAVASNCCLGVVESLLSAQGGIEGL